MRSTQRPKWAESTTILTLANDTNLNGEFFYKKGNQHWSWWVFPSATGNTSYKQFNFNDNSPIYKSIANNSQYLTAYTKVLGYITEEIKKTPVSVAQHIDFTKAVRCYYRIYLQTKDDNSKDSFNNQFLAFCDELKRSKNTILRQQKQHYSKYFSNNEQLIENCCAYSQATTIDDTSNIHSNKTKQIIKTPIKPKPIYNSPSSFPKEYHRYKLDKLLPTPTLQQHIANTPTIPQSQPLSFIPKVVYQSAPVDFGLTSFSKYTPKQSILNNTLIADTIASNRIIKLLLSIFCYVFYYQLSGGLLWQEKLEMTSQEQIYNRQRNIVYNVEIFFFC